MLKQLHISNYALIDELSVGFETGFNVITGETGAGKSILLGALGFALGDRADTGVLYDKDKKCVVEAQFELDDENLKPLFEENDLDFETECIFRRELNPQKKSRAFINDTPVALQTMKEIGSQLVDIHSQHDSLLLTDADFQLKLLDEIAQNGELLTKYQTEYSHYNALKRKLNELKEMATKNTAENDYLKFQLDELDKADLKEGEYAKVDWTQTKSYKVYLPAGAQWYDYWTNKKLDGGQTLNVTTTLAHSPLYIKAGSIMPMSPEVQYANENKFDKLDIVVYPGANAKFTLYEDEGDNYNYEKGAYSTIELTWNDKAKSLTIGKRQGSFEGMLSTRTFNVKVIGGKEQSVKYNGKALTVK